MRTAVMAPAVILAFSFLTGIQRLSWRPPSFSFRPIFLNTDPVANHAAAYREDQPTPQPPSSAEGSYSYSTNECSSYCADGHSKNRPTKLLGPRFLKADNRVVAIAGFH
jgi:hypothetical protein